MKSLKISLPAKYWNFTKHELRNVKGFDDYKRIKSKIDSVRNSYSEVIKKLDTPISIDSLINMVENPVKNVSVFSYFKSVINDMNRAKEIGNAKIYTTAMKSLKSFTEGDIKFQLEMTDNVVTDAWSAGIMYRGFENILVGRGQLDGLVITPRICGICSTSHLNAAAKALDMICGVVLPDDALRIRNISLMVEMLQSDIRQRNHGVSALCRQFHFPASKPAVARKH